MEPLWMSLEMHRWEYAAGSAPWEDIVDWCWKHFIFENWSYNWDTITFLREQDYSMFLLRWS